jgi:hypothetical protein
VVPLDTYQNALFNGIPQSEVNTKRGEITTNSQNQIIIGYRMFKQRQSGNWLMVM